MKKRSTRRITMSPQNTMVKDILCKKGVITPLNAMVNFGITRLAARIFELKKIGFKIDTVMKKINRTRYASYQLVATVQI